MLGVPGDRHGHPLDEGADDLLAVRRRGIGGVPQGRDVGGQRPDAVELLRAQFAAATRGGIDRNPRGPPARGAEPPPTAAPASGDQPVVRVDGPVAPLGQAGLVAGPLQLRPPVRVEAGPLPLDVPGRRQAQLDPGGRQGPQHLLADGRIQDRGADPGTGPRLTGLEVRRRTRNAAARWRRRARPCGGRTGRRTPTR